jgi:hypothetical protein
MQNPDWQTEHHISILTKCGVHRDNARKIIAMTDAQLTEGIAAVEGRPNKTPSQESMIAAARAELAYRKSAQ